MIIPYFKVSSKSPLTLFQNNCVRLGNRNWNENVGKWDDYECDNALGYICKTQASPAYNPPLPPEHCDDPEISGSNFIKFDGACYIWKSSPEKWIDAESSCRSMNAHLVSINSPMEQAYVFTRVESESSWIGLSNRQVHPCYNIGLYLYLDCVNTVKNLMKLQYT